MRIAVVDIGGTMVKSALWDGEELIQKRESPTHSSQGGKGIMEQVVAILKQYKNYERIAVATAGQVDPVRGMVRYANPNIPGYTGTQIKEVLESTFGLPTVVENDVNAAGIGEFYLGAGVGYKNFICLTYGTGIGGSVFVEGQLYRGSSFSAGEFGCMVTHGNQRVSGKIMSGTYEDYASVTALVREAKKLDDSLNSGRKIFERIRETEVALLVDNWMDEVALGLVSLVHIFNPQLIIMGGGIMNQKFISQDVEKKLKTQIMESFSVKVKAATLGNDAGLMGVLQLAKIYKQR